MRKWLCLITVSMIVTLAGFAAPPVPKTVHFMSEDGKTRLVGYLFEASTGLRAVTLRCWWIASGLGVILRVLKKAAMTSARRK